MYFYFYSYTPQMRIGVRGWCGGRSGEGKRRGRQRLSEWPLDLNSASMAMINSKGSRGRGQLCWGLNILTHRPLTDHMGRGLPFDVKLITFHNSINHIASQNNRRQHCPVSVTKVKHTLPNRILLLDAVVWKRFICTIGLFSVGPRHVCGRQLSVREPDPSSTYGLN